MLGAPVFRTALFGPWSGNALWTAARAVPSLDLPFADSKSLVDAITGRQLVTFARAGSGAYTDSAGVLQTAATDVPRFDHNPLTGESLGLLVEEQRTNLRTYSDAILAANIYGASNATLATVTTATPTGSATASLFTLNVGANTGNNTDGCNYSSAITLTNSTQYAQSLFVKPAGTTVLRLRNNALGGTHDFTLTGNGTAPSVSGGLQAASIVPFPNGWYRLSWTFTTTTTAPGNRADYWTIKTDIADGTSGVYVLGAQLEAGATASSYIPTTTAAATRNASLADLISSAIASNIRSFYVEFSSPAVGTRGAASLNDNTANERIDVITSGTDPRLVVHDGGVEQANINGGTVTANVKTRIAVRINTNDFAISINGGTAVTDTSGTLPTVDRLMIGRTQAGEYLNGRIARFAGWTELLSDVTLQSLSRP